MNYFTLVCLEKLIKQGAVVYGEKPVHTLSLADEITHKEKFKKLTQKIWRNKENQNVNESEYGKGKVLWGMSLSEAINKIDLSPDFSAASEDSTNFIYTHKRNKKADIYFVFNQLNHPVDANCQFRIHGKTPEIWDPLNGSISIIPEYENNKDSCILSYDFDPREAIFFVFRDNAKDDLKEFKNKILKEYVITDFNGSIEFHPAYEANIQSIDINKLKPLSEFEDKEIKYFSGKAKYTIYFQLPEDIDTCNGDWYLNLGKVDATADVSLNNRKLGYGWSPNQEFEISSTLKKNNILEVTVAIPYRNRFIGDFVQYGKVKNLWTSWDISMDLNADTPLKKVGLIGPVRIVLY